MRRHKEGGTPSGRFLLRIDPGLHGTLRRSAEEIGISLNDYCAGKLAATLGNFSEWQNASEAVTRAASLLGKGLVGVVAFGSWARGELRNGSDIDLLIVVDDVDVTRELYRRWDEAPILWGGRHVEPHFVRLPEPDRTGAGLWAEVAIDGIVLFARNFELPRRLASLRRDVAEGRIVRRVVHGQTYWVEAA